MDYHVVRLEFGAPHRERLLGLSMDLNRHFELGITVGLEDVAVILLEVLAQQEGWQEFNRLPRGQHHCLHLTHEHPDILNLPWHLCMERDGYHYITKGLPIQRNLPPYGPDNPLPLKILVMVSSPEDSTIDSRLAYEEEEANIIRSFEPLFERSDIEIDFTEDGSLENLESKLALNHYHILHFSGHGVFRDGEGYLELEDSFTLDGEMVSSARFAMALNKIERHLPSLVVLSSCETAQGTGEAGLLKGVTHQLLEIGVPAVVSMGFSIADYYATAFTSRFYNFLAERASVPFSFWKAIRFIEDVQREGQQMNLLPPQSIIPQLYLSKTIGDLVDWEGSKNRLRFDAFKFVGNSDRLSLERTDEFLFVGRRREMKEALDSIFQYPPQPIMLRGQGGVGKTTLAEQLVRRLIVRNPNTVPFAFNEGTTNLTVLLRALTEFFVTVKKEFLIERKMANEAGEGAIDRFSYLLEKLAGDGDHDFVFVFDNLEHFMDGKANAPFKREYDDLQQAIRVLVENRPFPVILTGRYPLNLESFPKLKGIDLNQVGLASFFVKTQQLSISELRRSVNAQSTALKGPALSYRKIVELLHQTLGGNYRALELFDGLFKKAPQEIFSTLDGLDGLKRQIEIKGREVVNEMAKDLVFSDLLAQLDGTALANLRLLARFRRPILPMALEMQGAKSEVAPLVELTLAEASEYVYANGETLTYYYVTPIVRDLLLRKGGKSAGFSERNAARYHEWAAANMGLAGQLVELEEAFHHYFNIGDKEKVNELGEYLVVHFYDLHLLDVALQIGEKVELLLKEEMYSNILNTLGLINQILGDMEGAFCYFKKSLIKSKAEKNIVQEATAKLNLGSNYYYLNDDNTALEYLQDSKNIFLKIGDKHGTAQAYANLAQFFSEKKIIEKAFYNFKKSLDLSRQLKDKKAEGKTLSNVSNLFLRMGNPIMAADIIRDCLKIFKELNDKQSESHTLFTLGSIYSSIGEYEMALKFLEDSLLISEQIGDQRAKGRSLLEMYSIYSSQEKEDMGLQYLDRGLQIFREIKDYKGEGTTLNLLSDFHRKKGSKELSLKCLKDSLKILEKIDDKVGMIPCLHNMAQIALENGDGKLAIKYETDAFIMAKNQQNAMGVFTVGMCLGDMLCRIGDKEIGIKILKDSLSVGQKAKFPDTGKVKAILERHTMV